MSGDISFTVEDPRHATDEDIAAATRFRTAILAESNPEDAPPDLAEAIAIERATPDSHRRRRVKARLADGTIVGAAGYEVIVDHDDNPDVMECGIDVLPGYRRRGIGTRLLAELVDLAEADGRTRLFWWTNERVPAGAAASEAVGATSVLSSHANHLPTAEVDRKLMEDWVAQGPGRAPGYELIAFDGACPDEHLDGLVSQIMVLNTAPRDDRRVNDFTVTPQLVREREQVYAGAGIESWTILARHTGTGAYAGIHDMEFRPTNPSVMWVGVTAVDPVHRGHALGKWLKATMTLRVLDERPGVDDIRTGNADSNAPMLGINHAMGYRPFFAVTNWELSVADARAWLDSRR